MNAIWEELKVIELSTGIAGPLTGMLAAGSGAQVTKIEPPGGDPARSLSGARVWNRGKRSAVLDLTAEADRATFDDLVDRADVLILGHDPDALTALQVDVEELLARNPRLVVCSITGYGDTRHAGRPAYDALVAARTGHQWESRGRIGGTLAKLAGLPVSEPDLETPDNCWVGAKRNGPIFSGIPWLSIGAGYLATLAIAGALRAREVTGRGQHVSTSLMQAVFLTTIGGWQRAERAESPGFMSTITDIRCPKGLFECADGRWVHNWGPSPGFALKEVGKEIAEGSASFSPSNRSNLADMHAIWPDVIDAYKTFTASEWTSRAKEGRGASVQPIRSPEEALADPDFLADGCVVEVDDPEVGGIRTMGRVIDLRETPHVDLGGAPLVGAHTDEVRSEAASGPVPASTDTGVTLGAPLAGIRVLDFGNAVAGPFGGQLLADLGAEVIKINTKYDAGWMTSHIAFVCNRSKRSIALDLEDPEGQEIIRQLIESADVIHHNLGRAATDRWGIGYEQVKAIKPDIVYCRTRAHEYSEVRRGVSGHDQSAGALAGTTWSEGGMDRGGEPLWPVVSLGDTGTGLLSAIGVVQALQHRDRTGEGQYVTTSIVYAHLVNNSMSWISADGRPSDRPKLDANQTGWHALYRIYEGSDEEWLCIAAATDDHWTALARAVGRDDLLDDERFADREARAANDDALCAELEAVFAGKSSRQWFDILDGAGVPVEISDGEFVMSVFDDEELAGKNWTASYDHGVVGKLDTFGLLFDFSETPGRLWGPPLVVGEKTTEILDELGYDPDQIANLIDKEVVVQA